MKKRFIFLSLFSLLLTAAACHKHDTAPKQYSTWIVNGQDTFRTNNVDTHVACNPDHSYCSAGLYSNDQNNWFDIGFQLDSFPINGLWQLGDTIQLQQGNSNFVYIAIYYNGIGYGPLHPNNDTLFVSSVNGNISYTLHPTWFFKYNNPNDSVIIQGVFNTP